jgi:glycosyltransferase involved in cell wall biosynthesis
VPEFPSLTHVFFWREAQALQELGVELSWISTRPPAAPCPHAFGPPAAAATHYVFPPRAGAAARGLAGPGTAHALAYLAGLDESPVSARARRFALLPCAADLADFARQRRLDHLHIHSCAEAAHLGALARRLSGLSYSLTLHGDLPVYGTDHRAKMERAAFVSVVTRALRQQVRERVGLPEERLPIVRMGVSEAFFADARRDAGARPLHAVTVARLDPSKGHRHALRALKALVDGGDDVRYSIAGGGPEKEAIERQVAELGLGARVRILGGLGEAEVLRLLRSADAFVLPSVGLGEAAPVAVMEAMATGLPVLCTIIGGVPEMLTDGREGFLVPQADPAALTAALRTLAREPARRLAMGCAARERALAEFRASNCAAQLLERFEEARAARG